MPNIPVAGAALRTVLAVVDQTAELASTLRVRPAHAPSRPPPTRLGTDPLAFGPAEFEAVARHLEPLDRLIAAVPPDADGMRWRYLDEAVLFRCEDHVPTPFDEFTASLDISQVIGLTSGYLTGCTEVQERDEAGRPIRQLERSINRAQPAYLALSGADVLDVCKLETIDYGPDEQLLRWRQVHSANGSALQDDGSVSFARTADGTRVTIRAYQRLALPPLWRAITPVLWPVVRRALVEDAYRRSFRTTLSTIATRGRGVGTVPVEEPSGSASSLWDTLARVTEPLNPRASWTPWTPLTPSALRRPARPESTDSSGFRHFRPERQPR